MSAIVELFNVTCIFDGDFYRWSSPDNPTIAELLNSLLDSGGPSGSDPNPAGTAANEARRTFGAKIIDIEPTVPNKETVGVVQ